ncbi:MAG: MFS transporter [Kutzneria sp.]|nr:MFS transporter [Kutzneria sp.]
MRAYYTAATLARLGDEMVGAAVPLLVLARTGGVLAGDISLAGLTLAAYALPSIGTGPLLGAWLDGTRHRRAALATNQLALAASMLGLVATVGAAPGWTAPAIALVAGLTVPMASGGFTGMLPLLVAPDRLAAANSAEAVSFSVASMAGPAVAGTVALVVSPAAAVAMIAGVAILSLVALLAVPAVPPRQGTTRLSVRDGVRHLLHTPRLRAVTLTSTVSFGAVGMLVVALPVRTGQLGISGNASGFVLAAFEAGCVVTNLALIRLQNRWQTVLVCTAAYGVVLAGWAAAPSFPVLLGLGLVAGFTLGPELPALLAARQRYTPAGLLSQVGTTGASLKVGASAMGSALGGQLVPTWGAAGVFSLVAALQVIAVLAGLLVSRPRPAARPAH